MRAARRVAAVVAIAAGLIAIAALVGLRPDRSESPTARSALEAGTSPTTAVVTTATTVAPEPVSVLLAGDSIMGDTAPAVLAALRTAGQPVVARFELAPVIPRTLADLLHWQQIIDQDHPDLLVYVVGIWETATVNIETPLSSAGWQERYRSKVLEPWFGWLERNGVRTVWLSMAPIRDATVDQRVQSVMAVIAESAGAHQSVDFVPSSRALAPFGIYAEFLTGADGSLERVRRVDGLHLCPAGAQRMASLVLEALTARFGITVPDGWQAGSWRTAVTYDLATECPVG